jgi:hypothetical protein
MRLALVTAMFFALASSPLPHAASPALAQACTGDNCPPPAAGGHECESKKKEDTVS